MANIVIRCGIPSTISALVKRFQDRVVDSDERMLLVRDLKPEEIRELRKKLALSVFNETSVPLPVDPFRPPKPRKRP